MQLISQLLPRLQVTTANPSMFSRHRWQSDRVWRCVQKLTFCWQLSDVPSDAINIDAAAATLHSMAGRLIDLHVWCSAPKLLTALQRAGPALADSLSSLCFDIRTSSPQHDFRAAAQALRGMAAGLQHGELKVPADRTRNWSAARIQAADAGFAELMHSLPVCQRLKLDLRGCVSQQAVRQALPCTAPHLLTFRTGRRHGYEQVNSTTLQWHNNDQFLFQAFNSKRPERGADVTCMSAAICWHAGHVQTCRVR